MLKHISDNHDVTKESLLLHYRASAFLAISFAVMMKYKKIVLAGVDMFDMNYFLFDTEKYQDEVAEKLRVAKQESSQKALRQATTNLHRTADPGLFNLLPLDQVIVLYNEYYLKPKNIELTLLSEKSLLYPRIGLYKY